ncbi:hypothetical protein DFJ74DRAFT_648860 [Hyaloraphidium curvatum]|nr:hypothetical protein DFJ74DRAFT_648860 [Hyaloraphidium curvatum]
MGPERAACEHLNRGAEGCNAVEQLAAVAGGLLGRDEQALEVLVRPGEPLGPSGQDHVLLHRERREPGLLQLLQAVQRVRHLVRLGDPRLDGALGEGMEAGHVAPDLADPLAGPGDGLAGLPESVLYGLLHASGLVHEALRDPEHRRLLVLDRPQRPLHALPGQVRELPLLEVGLMMVDEQVGRLQMQHRQVATQRLEVLALHRELRGEAESDHVLEACRIRRP